MKCVLGIFLLIVYGCIGKNVQVKIVDPPHTNRYYTSSISSNSNQELTLRAPPANISGPPHLQLLAGECFKTQEKRYTYSICPFHNVTQKEEYSTWNSFHGVLGVWREWIIEEDRFAGMLYSLGEPCGGTDREAKVMFSCSTVTKFTNISELSTCKYTIWMSTPLACFKGIMQIYNVMTPLQISQWEVLNERYHNEELTKQGLDKKRRQILLEAGLYYNFTKDQEYLKKTHDKPEPATSKSELQGDLDKCTKEVSELENALSRVKMELELMQKVLHRYPELVEEFTKLLTQNITKNHTITLRDWPVRKQEDRIENDKGDQEHNQEDSKNQEHEYLTNQENDHQGDQETEINVDQVQQFDNAERTRDLLEQGDVIDEENLKTDELQPDK